MTLFRSYDVRMDRAERRRRFGEWLRTALDERYLQQADLAERSGIPSGLISRYFNGQTLPDQANAIRIADALRVDRVYVLELAGHRAEVLGDIESIEDIDPRVRWYFLNYRRLPPDKQRLLLRQLDAYFAELDKLSQLEKEDTAALDE